jgi:hypothetical protein
MSRIPALLACGLALSAPCLAQESPPAAAAEREEISPKVETTPAPAAETAVATPAPANPQKFGTMDRIELDSTAITGNRELPKVLYIVPWKKADIGDLIGRPANSLLDEVLTPVDREVFRRQTDYFTKLNAGASPQSAAPPAEPGR